MNQKCETCVYSRPVASKNGTHYNCCLREGLAFLCSIGKVDRYTHKPNAQENPTEGDGQE